MRKTYDIAGDLDTPVSAFMKLGAFQPRFLLESVEGGERLGRYSFIGFGDSVEFRLDSDALYLNGVRGEVPADRDALLASLRGALARVDLEAIACARTRTGRVFLSGHHSGRLREGAYHLHLEPHADSARDA